MRAVPVVGEKAKDQLDEANRKQLPTLQAKLACRGFGLRRTEADIYIVTRPNLARALATRDDLPSLALQVGGQL